MTPTSPISKLSFRYPFRKYQRMILAQMESQTDKKYHIVAPPGSGKTIVGIELIRRFGFPAVVFAPTATIQAQWREKLGMFLEDASQLNGLASLDPWQLAPINIFTYQLISTPGEAQEHEREIARKRWIQDLLEEGQSADETSARARLETLSANNPVAYRKELSRTYLRIKRDILHGEGSAIQHFLHPNARQLIEALVNHGVRTVVLDECHHLLDYWAIVLRYLIAQIPEVRVVGLTATLPSPEDDNEYENYTSLLGDVDFEVPTPAVVKEGDLAPYRDLVYFVQPSPREVDYLKHIQDALEGAIAETAGSQKFRDWVARPCGPGWEDFLRQYPLFSLATARFLRKIGYPIPIELEVPVEAEEPLAIEDWAVLLERYGLDILKVSPEPADHKELAQLKNILFPFGFTLTEKGMRQSRSAGDLVLTFSESKDRAVADILVEESGAMGERLRAMVVTDFEKMSSGVNRPRASNPASAAFPLDRDAGSALRLFHHLVDKPDLAPLHPVLVTGSTLMVDSTHGPELLDHFNAYLSQHNFHATCRFREETSSSIREVTGEGRDWYSRTYVAMITSAFEHGVTRCLVGTRGIFGEGWDSLSLNTLIDLTSVTTSTAVQQLRGRSIRKDPSWPRKVAHNWDVICVAPRFKKGDADLRRFVQRHARYWGIVPPGKPVTQYMQDAKTAVQGVMAHMSTGVAYPQPAQQSMQGQIVKGITHVSPELAYQLAVSGFEHTPFERYNRLMFSSLTHRDQTYDLWNVGGEYSNFVYSAARLDVVDLKIRTVFTVEKTLKRMLREFWLSIVGGIGLALWYGLNYFIQGLGEGAPLGSIFIVFACILAIGTFLTFLFNLRSAYRLAKAFLVDQPPDGILLDVGRALAAALKDSGLISRNMQADFVRVVEQPDRSYQVLLDYASPEDAAAFISAYGEIFEPVRDQRYLILRDDNRLPHLILAPLWLSLRNTFRSSLTYQPAYHPVPKILAVRKELAEAFAQYWKKYVGGGKLVFTRSETGRFILLQARTQRRPKVKGLAFEIWK